MSEDPLSRRILVDVLLILVQGFLTLAWYTLEQASENKLKKFPEASGDGSAQRLLRTVQNPEMFLTGMQLAVTFLVMTLAAYSVRHFSPAVLDFFTRRIQLSAGKLSLLSDGLVLICVLLASFIFGDMLPRRAAALRPGLLRMVFFPAWLVSRVLSPVSWLLTRLTGGLLRLLRIKQDETDEVSEDEIRMMVDIGEVAGAIQATEKEMIENVFEFNNMTAEDIMVHRKDMVVIWEEDSEEEIIKTIRDSGLSRFPVCREDVDDIVGILSTRDYLLNHSLDDPKPLAEIMWSAYFVPESVRTDLLFRDLQREKVHMAIVVDEYGGTSGLLTLEDLLEQLVGEIYDEFDTEDEQEIIKLDENLWRIHGGAELETVCEALEIEMPEEEEYDTLGGLVFSQLSVIPDDGSHPEVEVHGLHIVVETLQDRRVEWAAVSKIIPEPVEETE